MRETELWQPSKFVVDSKTGVRRANPAYVSVGSRFIADILAREYEQVIARHARGSLLDCGCGNVPLYDIYRDLVSNVTCTDWGNTLHRSIHVDEWVDLNGPIPFEDQKFDTIILADVLEHIQEPAALLLELHRILRPGGKLIAMVPFFYWLHEEPHDFFRYTQHGLRLLSEKAGLKVEELEAYGGLPDVLGDLTCKSVARHGAICRAVASAWSAASRSSWYRKVNRRSSAQFPLGYCLVAQHPEGA